MQRKGSVFLIIGIAIAELGMLLIGLGGCDALKFKTRMLFYVCGTITCLSGLLLIWIDAIRMAVAWNEPALISGWSNLGKFRLNGYLFEAYEQGGDNGIRTFRLISSPSVSPAREAAFVRYLVQEGLIESMWPEMSSRIEEEANWAFLQ